MSTNDRNWAVLSDEELYSSFTARQWRGLPSSERIGLLQEVENRQARLSGRPPMTIIMDPKMDPGLMGYYDHTGKSIHLNERYFINSVPGPSYSPGALLDTVLHEGRHAWQFLLAYDPSTSRIRSDLLKVWKANTVCGGYTRPKENLALYFQQSIERDARMYALREMERISQVIQPDLSFHAAIVQARQEEYRHIAEARELFPTLEALDAFEKKFMEKLSRELLTYNGIDPRTFRFFTETRAILEMTCTAGMKPEAVFRVLEQDFCRNDFDLALKVYDHLMREHPEKIPQLQKQKLETLERNRKWKQLIDGRAALSMPAETLEKRKTEAVYRIGTGL